MPITKKDNAKECSHYHTTALISQANKVILKILQARLQEYVNQEIPDVQAGFRKGRGTRSQVANICWITDKAKELEKNFYFCFTDCAKAFVWITANCGKFFKRWEYPTTWPAAWEMLELDMEWWIVSTLGKEYIKAVYCHPAYLTYVQSTHVKCWACRVLMWNAGLDEFQAGIKISGRNINNLKYVDNTTLMAESEEELKSLLMKVKTTFKSLRSWHLVPSLHGK